jgi:hypothetical protein
VLAELGSLNRGSLSCRAGPDHDQVVGLHAANEFNPARLT